jgi:hypothetical protein
VVFLFWVVVALGLAYSRLGVGLASLQLEHEIKKLLLYATAFNFVLTSISIRLYLEKMENRHT